ncbi:MAG: type II toxin-antitoxin system VapC family toxin [bacterium]
MRMPDVNVLIYAHREDAHAEHLTFGRWLSELATASEPFALSPAVLSGVVRIVTNPRVFARPSTLDEVFAFIDELCRRPTARLLGPGPRHRSIFTELCLQTGASAKLVADAYHAAVAMEHGCCWVTTDSDFARFPGLRWEHPLRPR